MKRRQFILTAAIASLYTPAVLGKAKEQETFQYFKFIGAVKKRQDLYAENAGFRSLLQSESKSLIATGYLPESYLYTVPGENVFFISYSLSINSVILDSQYLVFQTQDHKSFRKIACLSLDFLKATELAAPDLQRDCSTDKLKSIFLPVEGRRHSAFQVFSTREGAVSFISTVHSNYRAYSLEVGMGLEIVAFRFKASDNSFIS